jgi:glucose-1-phosphate thymidylyltransferase
MKEIIGLIPAAGQGTRLGLPFPKELWPLPGQTNYIPVAFRSVEVLLAAGVRQIVIVTSPEKPAIMRYFGDGTRFGAQFIYMCQEAQPGGGKSAGLSQALDCAYPVTAGKHVAFVMPDTYVHPTDSMTQMLSRMDANDLTLGLFATDKPHKFGMVRMNGSRVYEIIDKPSRTDLKLMWGIILWSPRFSDFFHDRMCRDATDFATVMNSAVADKLDVRAIEIADGRYIDFGTYDDLVQSEAFIRSVDGKRRISG